MIHPSRRLLLALGAGALAGCSSILPKGNPPPQLFRLTPAPAVPGTAATLRGQLLVDTPLTPAGFDTDRIALSRSATTMDYFGGVAWSDRLPIMIQTLLIESLEASGRAPAVARESLALRSDWDLKPDLRHFEAQYGPAAGGSDAPPEIRVSLAVKLVRTAERSIVDQHLAEATQRAERNELPMIIDAFNAATHSVLQELVAWTLATAK